VTERLRIVVTGLAITFPLGGVFWDYVQYVLGFQQLGHDVLYLEDTGGRWCYDVTAQTFVEAGGSNAARFDDVIAALAPSLAGRWFFRDARNETYGMPWETVTEFCRTADLFVHNSASCRLRDEYRRARRLVFIDSDPMYTQSSFPRYADGAATGDEKDRVAMLLQHDHFFTFGENVGAPDCRIPEAPVSWQPTRQPIVLDRFSAAMAPLEDRRRVLTTVASWETSETAPIIDGIVYGGKSQEFERFLDLPARSPLPLELALSGPAPRVHLAAHGWHVVDGHDISRDPATYRDYLARSFAEWSVAKNAYVASRSGWFSCRSACYLALGVPVIVQDTGFQGAVPAGEGLLAFTTMDEAAAAIEQVVSDPTRHARAAAEVAREYFDACTVLGHLIERSLTTAIPVKSSTTV
jgi:hypothetical protein